MATWRQLYQPNDFSAGLAARVCNSWAKGRGAPSELSELVEKPEMLEQVLRLIRKTVTVVPSTRLVISDFHAAPLRSFADGFHSYGLVDEESLKMKEFDLAAIKLEQAHASGEVPVDGAELSRRLRERGNILLDARLPEALLRDDHLIPESWKAWTTCFDGTVFRCNLPHCGDEKYTVGLVYRKKCSRRPDEGSEWAYVQVPTNQPRGPEYFSAVLVPSGEPTAQ